jgi:hypothetical protein
MPLDHLIDLKTQGKLNNLPHILIEVDLIELTHLKDQKEKEKLFKDAFARLNYVNEKITKSHLNTMLDLAFGDFAMQTNQLDAAQTSFEQAVAGCESHLQRKLQ